MTHDRRRTTPGVWHKLPTGELKTVTLETKNVPPKRILSRESVSKQTGMPTAVKHDHPTLRGNIMN